MPKTEACLAKEQIRGCKHIQLAVYDFQLLTDLALCWRYLCRKCERVTYIDCTK